MRVHAHPRSGLLVLMLSLNAAFTGWIIGGTKPKKNERETNARTQEHVGDAQHHPQGGVFVSVAVQYEARRDDVYGSGRAYTQEEGVCVRCWMRAARSPSLSSAHFWIGAAGGLLHWTRVHDRHHFPSTYSTKMPSACR